MALRCLERTIRFRFVGRFVFAEPTGGDGTLRALAVDPTFCRDVPSECHRVTMTAPWDCVNPLGSCLPDLRLFSSSTVSPTTDLPGRLEQGVWFLDGCAVAIERPGKPPDFTWDNKDHLLCFDTLVGPDGNAALNPERANNVGGPVGALFRVSCGVGRPSEFPPDEIALAELHTADQSRPDPQCTTSCDFVDVVLTLGPAPFTLTIASEQSGRRCITLLTQPGAETVVTFSNLCPRTSFESFDAEFASLYEVLADPPATRLRRVPRAIPDLNGKIDCHSPVSGTY